MMDGLAEAAGVTYREISVAGKTYRLASPRLADLAALEAEILARLPDPVQLAAVAVQHVPAEQRAAYWEAAFTVASRRTGSLRDLDDLPATIQLAAAAYAALHRHHADQVRTLDDARDWLAAAIEEHGDGVAMLLKAFQLSGAGGGAGGAAENPPAATRP